MVKTLVIGDIHGSYAELHDLLAKAALAQDDQILAVGDIVDRGPETPEVLAFFRDQPKARSLLGNHERKHLRGARGELSLALSQKISRKQFGDEYPEALDFMDTLPLYMELPDAIVVHGYVEPGVPLEVQRPRVLCGTMGGDNYLRATYDQPWYELWDGEKPVIVGHLDYLRTGKPFVYRDKIYGLDTGCVHGGRLTGLILPDFKFVSVPSRGDHWHALRKQYRFERRQKARKPPYQQPNYENRWGDEGEQHLANITAYVVEENARILSILEASPEYPLLTPRQKGQRYQALASASPVNALLHLARLGKLTLANGRRVLKEAARAAQIAKVLNLHED